MQKTLLTSLIDGICNLLCETDEDTQPHEQEAIMNPEHFKKGDVVQLVPWNGRTHQFIRKIDLTGEETFIVRRDVMNEVRVLIFRGHVFLREEDINPCFLRFVRSGEVPAAYVYEDDYTHDYCIRVGGMNLEDSILLKVIKDDYTPIAREELKAYLERLAGAISLVPLPQKKHSNP